MQARSNLAVIMALAAMGGGCGGFSGLHDTPNPSPFNEPPYVPPYTPNNLSEESERKIAAAKAKRERKRLKKASR